MCSQLEHGQSCCVGGAQVLHVPVDAGHLDPDHPFPEVAVSVSNPETLVPNAHVGGGMNFIWKDFQVRTFRQ